MLAEILCPVTFVVQYNLIFSNNEHIFILQFNKNNLYFHKCLECFIILIRQLNEYHNNKNCIFGGKVKFLGFWLSRRNLTNSVSISYDSLYEHNTLKLYLSIHLYLK